MNKKNTGLGVFLLSIGVFWALMSFGVIDWSIFDALLVLWPLIFIVIGISIVFKDNVIVRSSVWIIFLVVLALYGQFTGSGTEYISSNEQQRIFVEKPQETLKGELQLLLGGIRLDVSSDTDKLIDAFVSDPDVKHTVDFKNGKQTAEVNINKKKYSINRGNIGNYDCKVDLNGNVIWNMDIKTGAVDGVIDMSHLKVEEFDLGVGAGKLKLIFGNEYENTNVDIDAGASMIDMVVPKSAGVKIKMDGALNKTNFDELNWQKKDGYYISPNYNEAASTIIVKVNMGVGKFTVNVE